MNEFVNEDAIESLRIFTKKLITLNEIPEALNVLEKTFTKISPKLETSILLNISRFRELNDKIDSGLISDTDADVKRANIKYGLLSIIDSVPTQIEIQQSLGKIKKGLYKTTSDDNLEKILGPVNNLVKINWLEKGIQCSRSVCQVVRSDGEKGTGFILKNGYLMTNAHVLPGKKSVAAAKIVFNYEEDLLGNMRKTSEYLLDPDDCSFSSFDKLDFAYIKIKDNPVDPLSKWGNLEIDDFSDPQINDPVTIIQHPLGETKQIALTANKIIGINGDTLLYQTDTEKGSSGSPVFCRDWKVIALHHAGKTEEQGGLVIDPKTGEKRAANAGILIKSINKKIKSID